MKIASLRNSMTEARAAMMATGAGVGVALAGATIVVSVLSVEDRGFVPDLLGLVFAFWMLGWLAGPMVVGGRPMLRAEHFALLPVPRRRLALGLFAAAFVAISSAITLLALCALVVYAARLGVGAAVIAVAATVLQLALAVALSQVAARRFGALMGSRAGGALAGALAGLMLVLVSSGWIVLVAIDELQRTGFSPAFGTAVRALPSGWGLVAVEAAARGDWLAAAAMLAATAAAVLGVLALWARSLARPPRERAVLRAPRRRARWEGSPATIVARRELWTWLRDPARIGIITLSATFALGTAMLPLAFDSSVLLPWAGLLCALIATATTVNLYGQDGTSLWMTLTTAGAEDVDVRGRQRAWLAVFAPLSLALTIALTALSGHHWTWLWTLSLLPAVLGGGAGLALLVGVTQLAPGPDPRRQAGTLEHADTSAQGILALFAAMLPAAIPAALLLAGERGDAATVLWAAVPVGLATGVLAWGMLGQCAQRRLRARGPELLTLMRSGRESTPAHDLPLDTVRGAERWRVLAAIWMGAIALFPQGLVPLAIQLAGGESRVWFLALYMPAGWRAPVAVMMALLGAAAFAYAARVYRRAATGRRLQATP